MQTKGVIGLMAAAAAAVVVTAAVSLSGGAPAVDPRAGKPVLPLVAPKLADVAKIVLKHGAGTITFVKKDKIWTVAEKSDYPADATKLRQMLLGLAQITYVEPKTARPDLYKRLNVEDPGDAKSQSNLLDIYDAKGGLLGAVIAGRRRIDELGGGNDGIYVRLPNEMRSWLARGTLDLDGDITQWLDRRVVDIDQNRIKEAVLRSPTGVTLTISRDKPADKFSLKELPAGRKLKSDTTLVEPATVLQGFDLTDVKGASELAFPKEGLTTATFTTFDGLAVDLSLMKQGEKDWIRLTATASGDGKAKTEAETLNKRWSPWVYGIAEYKATALRTKLEDVLAPPEKPASSESTPASPPKTK